MTPRESSRGPCRARCDGPPAGTWTRRRALGILGLSAVTAAVSASTAGCTALPRSGQVEESRVQATDRSPLVQTAEGPAVGATATEIVSGFLRACQAGFSDEFVTARSFLLREAAKAWLPRETVSVYPDTSSPALSQPTDTSVEITVDVVGSVSANGFLAQHEAESTVIELALGTDDDGEWRIADLPGGVLLSQDALSSAMTTASVFFLSADRSTLVPDLRWLPRRGLAESVVSALLSGPADWLLEAVTTAVPDGAVLESVQLDAGQASVTFSGVSADLDPQSAGELVSQVQASVLSVASVAAVTVSAGSGSLGEGLDALLDARSPGDEVALSEGAVVRGHGAERSVILGAASLSGQPVRHPALAVDGSLVLVEGSTLVRVPDPTNSPGALGQIFAADEDGTEILAPVVDRAGWAWTASGGSLLAVSAAGTAVSPSAAWLTGREVLNLDISAESARVVLRHRQSGVGGQGIVSVAAILRDGDGAPTGLGTPVELTGARATRGLAWLDEVTVAVLVDGASSGSGEMAPTATDLRQLLVPGTASDSSGVDAAASVATDRVGGSLLVTDSDGAVWRRTGATWRVVTTDATDVSFPLV